MSKTPPKTSATTDPVMFDLVLRAAVLGRQGFHNGLRAPAQDAAYMLLLKGRSWKEGSALADAWNKAWQREHLIEAGILAKESA